MKNMNLLRLKGIKHILFVSLLLFSSTLLGQLISLKTIPVATGDQFLIHPSQNMGMGGISISLTDSLLDHWINPARGAAIQGVKIYTSPVYYRIGNGFGAARSMPISLVWSDDAWFAGGALAIQAMNLAESQTFWGPDVRTLSSNLSENKYFSGFVGRKFKQSSLALSAYRADLSALDGVDLLYANSEEIKQDGDITDLRLGWQRTGRAGSTQEVMLIYNELDMLHKVTYQFWGWERFDEEVETNLDHTVTWGLHTEISAPMNASGWNYGALFTANVKDHPKIPNYEIMNIPRDPGSTTAYNIGVGISKRDDHSSFGIDMIYEPIRSNTWAAADTFMISAEDQLIRPGDKTIENDFEFSNWVLRSGLGWQTEKRTFQLGMQMRTIHYWLDQVDNVLVTTRDQEEYWVEWTTTWGVTLDFSDFKVRYAGRTTMGTGRPGVDAQGIWFGGMEDGMSSGDFIIAPSDALTLEEARVVTHQLSISLPIGR